MTITSRNHVRNGFSLALLSIAMAASGLVTGANAATTARTPQSIECSKQADAKGLHGKERKTFRAACKRQAMTPHAANSTQTAPAKTSY